MPTLQQAVCNSTVHVGALFLWAVPTGSMTTHRYDTNDVSYGNCGTFLADISFDFFQLTLYLSAGSKSGAFLIPCTRAHFRTLGVLPHVLLRQNVSSVRTRVREYAPQARFGRDLSQEVLCTVAQCHAVIRFDP